MSPHDPPAEIRTLLDETVRAVRASVGIQPRVGVVLGSGLGAFADRLRDAQKLPYAELPHMPIPRVAGHEGNLCFGYVDDVAAVFMQGRAHLYEGHPVWQVVHGVRVMALLGVHAVLVTQAAGALDASLSPGTLMVVTDHLNLMFHDALADPRDDFFKTPYPDMRTAYDPGLRDELYDVVRHENLLSARIAKKADTIELKEGVYAALRDPSCETPAQSAMLRAVGAHAVGMSTVPEVTALRQLGVRVTALSYVSHLAAGIGGTGLEDDDVTARLGLAQFQRVARGWVLRAGRE